MTARIFRLGLSVLVVTTMASGLNADEGTDFFENRIRPVLVAQCYKCHSGKAQASGRLKGGLLLDTREGARRGGDSGPAVVPSNLKKSLILSALRHEDFEMPPSGRLPKNVVADFAKWIAMGAPDPRDGKADTEQTIDLDKGREFWSFQPVRKSSLAPTAYDGWAYSDVDRYVEATLRKSGLETVNDAPATALVRRLYFDLIGLPPSPEELDEWIVRLTEDRTAAVRQLVDSLLESPAFGERWGRHWLDVARYAESNGNSRNATFPHAWRYRDYVIDAFNADIPYDEFVVQQIAGDLLPHDSVEERNRNLVATGFLALGSKPVIRGRTGGFIPDIAADQIEVVSRSVLALTVACARCHDHKFDPIPTTDYYGLAGVFASSQTLYGGGGNSMGGAPATGLHVLLDRDASKQKAYDEWKKKVDDTVARQREVSNELKKLRPKRNRGKKGANAANVTPERKKQISNLEDETKQLAATLKKLRAKPVEPPGSAMGIRESGRINEVPVYVRGVSPKGNAVSRRVLSVVSAEGTPEFPGEQSGRLELARWLTNADNPLTARVMVNRVWLHLFGEGLVRTPDNFGVNGDRPSHPELLDWLAATFVEDGWSVKRLIRRLVLTRTYQLADTFNARNYESDPDNILLWRHSRRRLEAEAIRDAILAASGRLKTDRPAGSVVTVHGGKLIQDALTPDKIHQPSRHRSVYLPVLRNGLPEVLEVFDVADPSLVVGRRSVTTVPAQDLYLMNNPFVIENSRAFAERLLNASTDDDSRIDTAYRTALSRVPSDQERQQARDFIETTLQSLEDGADSHVAAWSGFCQALFVSAEFRYLR